MANNPAVDLVPGCTTVQSSDGQQYYVYPSLPRGARQLTIQNKDYWEVAGVWLTAEVVNGSVGYIVVQKPI